MNQSTDHLSPYVKKENNTFEEVGAHCEEMQRLGVFPLFMPATTISTPTTVDLTSFSNGSSSDFGREDSQSENSRYAHLAANEKRSLQRRLRYDECKNDNDADSDETKDSSVLSDIPWSWKEKSFDTPTRFDHERKSVLECHESPISPNDTFFLDTSLSSHPSDTSSYETLSDEYHNMNVSAISRRLKSSTFSNPYSRLKHMPRKLDNSERYSKSLRTSSSMWLRVVAFLIMFHTFFSTFLLVRIERLPYHPPDGTWSHPLLRRQNQNVLKRVRAADPQLNEPLKAQNGNLIFIKAIEGLAPLYPSNVQLSDGLSQAYHRERLGFSSLDRNMYSFIPVQSRSGIRPRIVSLSDTELILSRPRSRVLDIDRTPFTDNTQLYGLRDSSDGALSRMETASRDNDDNGECLSEPWHNVYQPSCNAFHELDMVHIDDVQDGGKITLFPKQGFWRNAWKVDFPNSHDSCILKTAKYSHDFESKFYETDRVDALAMSRLTFSPHAINIYSFCSRSVMTELASEVRLGTLVDKARKEPLRRLRIAVDLAQGLADVHYGKNGNEAEFVHLDINTNNVVVVGDKLKINDFNIGMMIKQNSTSGTRCTFPTPPYPNAQWRSPEEVNNSIELTEKVDVFSMGHIFYRMLVGHEPWNKVEPGGRPSRTKLIKNVKSGKLPFIPKQIKDSKNPETQAIYTAMMMCYTINASDRPSSKDISRFLRQRLQLLEIKIQSATE